MAHLDKYDRKELRKISRETYRELEQDKYKNYVDSARTNQNYSMRGFTSSKQFMDALDDRTQDIIDHDMDGKPPRNDPKYGSWVVTCPEALQGDPEKRKRFFQLYFEFVCERYGEKNVIDCVVHMDETSPHATSYVIPACVSRKSGKKSISAASVFNLKDMKMFHHDFNKVCEKEFGISNLIMRADEERENDRRDLSLIEYKREQEQRKDEAAKQAEQEAAEIVNRAKREAAEIKTRAEQEAAEILKEAEAKREETAGESTEQAAEQAEEIRQYKEAAEQAELWAKDAEKRVAVAAEKLRAASVEIQRLRAENQRSVPVTVQEAKLLDGVQHAPTMKPTIEFIIDQYDKFHKDCDTERVKRAKAARDLPNISGIQPTNSGPVYGF